MNLVSAIDCLLPDRYMNQIEETKQHRNPSSSWVVDLNDFQEWEREEILCEKTMIKSKLTSVVVSGERKIRLREKKTELNRSIMRDEFMKRFENYSNGDGFIRSSLRSDDVSKSSVKGLVDGGSDFWEVWFKTEAKLIEEDRKANMEFYSLYENELQKQMEEDKRRKKEEEQELEQVKHVIQEIPEKLPEEKMNVLEEGIRHPQKHGNRIDEILENFVKILQGGVEFRKNVPQCKELWKEASIAVSIIAGNVDSVKKSARRLIDVLSRTKNHSNEIFLWICCIIGDKMVTQINYHNRQLVWSLSFVARILAEQFPEVVRVGVVGAIYRKSPPILDLGAAVMIPSQANEDTVRDMEISCRFLLSLYCVCGDLKALTKWVKAVFSLVKTYSILVPMQIYCFLEVATFDFCRLGGMQSMGSIRQMIKENVIPLLLKFCEANPRNTLFKYYVSCCQNVIEKTERSIPIPDGMRIESKESDISPNV